MLRPVSRLTRSGRPSPHLSRWFHASAQAGIQAQQKAPPPVTTSSRKPKIPQTKVEPEEAPRVKEDGPPVHHAKRNELGVQLLSRQLHSQIFKNVSFPPPDTSFVHIAREHLEMHGLDPSQGSVLTDTGFTLPPLQGSNLLEHFYRIGSHKAQPWLGLAKSFVQTKLPPKPDDWEIQSGWTKYYYHPDGSSYSEHVPYPMHDGKPEEILTFDVETMPKYHPYAIMACAASPNGWYSWISPWLLGESKNTQHLIPLGDPTVPRVIIGHNVSYDRGRILEEYNLKPTMNRFIDTMALHVAVKGISSHQRPAWMKYRKSKETEVEQKEEAVEAILELMSVVEKRMAEEVDSAKKEELRCLHQDMEDSLPSLINEELQSEAEVAVKRWEELTSANSLADVAKLHCNIDVDKGVRDDFLKATPDEIRENIAEYLDYCAEDVDVTYQVYVAALPEFLAGCPHPVSFAGILTMGSSFLTVNDEWESYIQSAEGVYREMEENVKVKLRALAEEAKSLMNDEEKWKGDVWLSQLDWSPKVAGKSRGIIPQTIEEAASPVEEEDSSISDGASSETNRVPVWYQEFQADPFAKKVYERTLPLLLKLSLNGHPLQYNYKERWHYLDGDEVQGIPTSGGKKIAQLFSSRHAGKLLETGEMTSVEPDLALAVSTSDKGDDVRAKILQMAQNVYEAGEQNDVWSQQLDWKMVSTGDAAPEEVPVAPKPKKRKAKAKPVKPPPVYWPKWYWELAKPKKGLPPGTLDVTVRTRIAPLLFRLSWMGWPLHHSREHGWTYRVPENAKFQTRSKPMTFYDPADDALNEQATNGGYLFYKLPHKDGDKANVGNPLSKTFMKYAEDGTLKSPGGEAKEALDMNAQCSYWISARDRIMNQMVVWQNRKVNMGFDVPKPVEGEKKKWGIILPQVITMGTVTRRAIEKTWLTASNAKKNRVGSELKAMVRAPEGYAIVGADVDSEELWISSCMGDAQFGLHGATAIGWMTLEGTKAAGTDLHSKTASILGISRDQAKIFNYSRIYGAGMRHAVLLLLQSNAGMLPDEAQKLAENLYASTKGKNTHRTDMFGRKFWFGGTESFVFNKLEEIALSDKPQTPALGCGVTYALSKEYLPAEFGADYMPSRINWVVQSSGVDYLHLLIVSMDHLITKYDIDARYLISVHDELRYLVKEEDKYRAALALQIANLWTRSIFAYKLGMDDLPQGVAFFSAVDIDHVLRKEVDMPCVTPSQPIPIARGESLDITGVLDKTNGGSLWKDGHSMSTDTPEEYVGNIDGYTPPDCLAHRSASAAFLRAQATSDFGEVKGLAQKVSGKKFSGGIGNGKDSSKGKKSTGGKRTKPAPVGNGEGVDWAALVEKVLGSNPLHPQ